MIRARDDSPPSPTSQWMPGWIWISYLASSDIAVIDRPTGSADRFRVPSLSDSLVPYSRLARGPHGSLLEHWIGISSDTWSGNWDSTLPIVRWFARDGTLLGRAGSIRPAPGRVLTGALNRGFVDYAKDTVWFAEAASAHVVGIPVHDMNDAWPGLTIRLPVAFRMRPPAEFQDRQIGRTFARVEYHLTAFAVAPSAEAFALGYVLSWPDPEARVLYQPRTVLALYDRRRATLRAYDVSGRIWEVRMPTDDALVILLTDSRLGRRVVRSYRLQGPTTAGGHACAHDQA